MTEGLRIYAHREVRWMLLLGFSSGLPFLLVSSTLAFWLKDAGIAIATIGFFVAVRNVYSLKFLWAPLVNQSALPGLTHRMGQRRSWMLLGQAVVCLGLAVLGTLDVRNALALTVAVTLIVAIGSATQDISVDAWRIEIAGAELQPAMLAAYTLGYRIAILVTSWGALHLADAVDWAGVYEVMAILGLIGISTTLMVTEPTPIARDADVKQPGLKAWLSSAVVAPFRQFFESRGARSALWLLLFICIYRLSDFTIGNMSSTLYKHLGFSNAEIGNIVKFVGFLATIVGAFTAGWLTQGWPVARGLVIAAVMMATTNAAFALLATAGHDLWVLALVVGSENFAQGFAGVVFVAFLSALVDRRYTATQYALFSSLASLVGHTLAIDAGRIVEQYGYVMFFSGCGLLGVPAILMSLWLMRQPPSPPSASASPAKT